MKYRIEANDRTLDYVEYRLGDFHKRAPGAISNAINRATTNINSNISKKLRQEYIVKAAVIRRTLTRTRASRANLGSEVRSTGGVIPLLEFKVAPKTINPRRKSPIKAAVKKIQFP